MRSLQNHSPPGWPGNRLPQPRIGQLLLVCLLAAAAPARAEGPGIRVGESLVVHPGVALGVGYDSNVFFSSDNPPRDPVVGAAYIAVRPSLDLATRPAQRDGDANHTADFRLHLGVPLRFLLSSDSDVNQHLSIGGEVALLLAIFPFGQWSFDLFENFLRTSEPPYGPVKNLVQDAQAGNINIDQNQVGARLKWRPDGQRFETSLQYTLGVFNIEGAALSAKFNLSNDFLLRLRWKFFPKTALYLSAQETIYSYPNQGAMNAPPSALPFRAVAGLIGLITPKLSLDVNLGYGNSFTQANANYKLPTAGSLANTSYSSVVGLISLTWTPTALTIIDLGYKHDFAQALIGTYYDLDAGLLGISQLMWRFTGTLRGAIERRNYNGDLGPDGFLPGVGRTDYILGMHAQIDYPIKDYLVLSVGDDLTKNWSNCQFKSTTFGSPASPPCNYLRNDVWLRLAFSY